MQGRTFLEQDDTPGAAPVVMLSERVWREHFGGELSEKNSRENI
jgi:hypothetical protein